MKKLIFCLFAITTFFSCREEHPVQSTEVGFQNYPRVVRISSITNNYLRDSIINNDITLFNNSGKQVDLTFYQFRTSDTTENIQLLDAPATFRHFQSYTFNSDFPIDISTDTVFLYRQDTLVDTFYPINNQGF